MSTHQAYVTVDDLRAVVGTPQGQDDRLALACVVGGLWLDKYTGNPSPLTPYPWSTPITLELVPGPEAGYAEGALIAAVRAFRSPDFGATGVVGGLGDLAVRVNSITIPDAELFALGLRHSWGVA